VGQSLPNESNLPPQPPIQFWYSDDGWHEANKWLQSKGITIQSTDSISFIIEANKIYHEMREVVK
jgi:beta-lactam-binding protein with PASTA domain